MAWEVSTSKQLTLVFLVPGKVGLAACFALSLKESRLNLEVAFAASPVTVMSSTC